MTEIREGHHVGADLTGKLAHLLVRAFQEVIEDAEFMQDIERRWMNCVAAEIAQEISMLLKNAHVHAHARQQKSQDHAGGPASRNAATRLDRLVHAKHYAAKRIAGAPSAAVTPELAPLGLRRRIRSCSGRRRRLRAAFQT